ncbi:hypothetical protein [Variovorax sp. tm]|uniref:hypothetical protein n=1 Tax=Variovorax atrisoli TaxID=3394203 RepID=UPI003A808018
MNSIEAYFGAERTGGLVFVLCGALAIGVSAWGWRHGAFWRGAAWPLVLIALLQLGVGGMVWWRSPQDLERVRHVVTAEPSRLTSEEIPRMQRVVDDFVRNRWIEIALVVAGVLAVFFASPNTASQGAGAALAIQSGVVLVLDSIAKHRADDYLAWLRSL